MKFQKITLGLCAALALGVSSIASALPLIDVAEAPVGFFIPVGESTTGSPWYRDMNEDWGWTHGGVETTGATTVELSISAYDVDAGLSASAEFDGIYVWDNDLAAFWLLGYLEGANNIYSFTTFLLPAHLYDEAAAGLQVSMDIDANNTGSWLVTLAKSVVSVDGAILPDPNPTCNPQTGQGCATQVPVPGSLALLSIGLLGFAATRRRKRA